MDLSLEQKANLKELSKLASELLVDIIDESLPKAKVPTENDLQFKEVLSLIYHICPQLSDSYAQMYNQLQEQKKSTEDSYVKRLKKI